MNTTVRNEQHEALFKSWNIPFRLEEAVPIDGIKIKSDAQVREIAHIAVPENVDGYALQMRSGIKFPPVTIWTGILLDGNTRLEAARQVGMTTFPAYVVEVPSIQLARIIAAALNQTGSLRLSQYEARRVALDMMEQNFTDGQIAAALAVTAESARQWRRLHEVEDRAERTGTTDLVGKLPKTVRMQLAQVTHDQPFRDLVTAISQTRPELPEVKAAVAAVKDASSDDAALAAVAAARAEWTPIGPEPAKVRINRPAQQARMHLGGLLKAVPTELIDPAKLDADRARWEQVAHLAAEVLRLMDEVAAA